jgi:hypothetical protein
VEKVLHEIFGSEQQENMKRSNVLWAKSLYSTGAGLETTPKSHWAAWLCCVAFQKPQFTLQYSG